MSLLTDAKWRADGRGGWGLHVPRGEATVFQNFDDTWTWTAHLLSHQRAGHGKVASRATAEWEAEHWLLANVPVARTPRKARRR